MFNVLLRLGLCLGLLARELLGGRVGHDELGHVHGLHGKRGVLADLHAGAAAHAIRGLDGDVPVDVEVEGARGADLRAVAAHGALARVAHRDREVDVLGQALVVLQRAHNELTVLSEHTLAVVRGLRADRSLERALELVKAARVSRDLVRDGLGSGKRRIRARKQALGGVNGAAHELRALVLASELVGHLGLVGHKAKGGLRPLLRSADGVAVELLARSGLAAVADADGQVNADVVVVGHEREPQVAADSAHAAEDDLVALGQALEGARAGDVALLVGRRGAGNLVVDLARHVAARADGLGRADRGAQAALAAVVADDHRLLMDLDGVDRADVEAAGAGVIAARGGAKASVRIGERLFFVVCRVEDLALARVGGKRVGNVAERVGKRLPVALDIDQVVE